MVLVVVFTGGPCSGKTTIIEKVKTYFQSRGRQVFTLFEIPTKLHECGFMYPGVAYQTTKFAKEFEKQRLKIQIELEDAFMKMAKLKDNSLLLLDRGILDARAFCTKEFWMQLCHEFDLTHETICERYDMVFQLTTLALTDKDLYRQKMSNNDARPETVEDALFAEERSRKAWEPYPNKTLIHFYSTIEEKANTVIQHITRQLSVGNTIESKLA